MKIRIFDANRRGNLKGGYAIHANQTAENLKALGHDVVFFPDDNSGEDVVLWIRPPHYVLYPEFNNMKTNVFFTMHEKETFEGHKKDWCELLNRCKAVITPTLWNKKIFENNGVVVPIYVCPLGVNPKDFHGAKTFHFSVLTLHEGLGLDGSRENWKETLRAWYDAFYANHSSEVLLNIKSWSVNYQNFYAELSKLQKGKDIKKCPPVNVIDLTVSPQDLNDLYAQHWLFLKNANREGWCLPLWEAISAGLRIAYAELPVYENLVDYKDKTTFKLGDTKALTNIFLDEFRNWKKSKGFVTKYSWRNTTKQLEGILAQIITNS